MRWRSWFREKSCSDDPSPLPYEYSLYAHQGSNSLGRIVRKIFIQTLLDTLYSYSYPSPLPLTFIPWIHLKLFYAISIHHYFSTAQLTWSISSFHVYLIEPLSKNHIDCKDICAIDEPKILSLSIAKPNDQSLNEKWKLSTFVHLLAKFQLFLCYMSFKNWNPMHI